MIYIHIPFCKKKCPYCHFFVVTDKQEKKKPLVEALRLDWGRWKPEANENFRSIYFGGGTPSLMDPSDIAEIISWFPKSPDCEITLEANPEHTTLELMRAFKKAGVNRVSLGVQSFDDDLLAILGREHGRQKAEDAIRSVKAAGIDNITIDLMIEVPHQTLASFEKTLDVVETLPIDHLSLYNLTIEPHTPFDRKRKEITPFIPSPELSLKLLERGIERLEKMGFERYEISAFAKKGKMSRHNIGYWTARPFMGIGPSAFSYWNKKRMRTIANLERYSEALQKGESPFDFVEELPYPANLHELLAVQLRLLEGVDLAEFQKRHGALPAETFETLQKLEKEGLLIQEDRIKLSPKGLLFYDTVATEII